MFCVFLVIWGVLEHQFKFEKKSRLSRTKSHPAEEERARQPVDQESAVERHCRRHHRSRALRIAPVCKESPPIQAQGLRHQIKGRERLCLDLEVTRSERDPTVSAREQGKPSARSTAPRGSASTSSTSGRGTGRESYRSASG